MAGRVFMMPQFPEQPLLGVRVMATRPESPRDPLVDQLRSLGAEIIVQPAIRIADPPDWRPVDAALGRLDAFDWLVFSSANGVRFLFDRLRALSQQHLRAAAPQHAKPALPPSLKLAAMGPGTAEALAEYGLHADLMPEQFRAEDLAGALVKTLGHAAKGCRLLLARASRGRETLAEELTAAGAEVEQVVVYSSIDVEFPNAAVAQMLDAGQIAWITVTSSAIARSLVRLFGNSLHRSKLASISPLTSSVLCEMGYEPAAEATEFTMPGLAAAIVDKVNAAGKANQATEEDSFPAQRSSQE